MDDKKQIEQLYQDKQEYIQSIMSGVLNYYESEHEGLDISSLFLVLRQSR